MADKLAQEKSDFAEREEKILQFWKENRIFEKTLEKNSPAGEFVFYEGPPTANGRPGIHHLESRAFKDVIPRYKTMRGFHVRRKAGWDTHGLPVELEVEKQLGFSSKKEIEAYGIAAFNKKCKESVHTYMDEWARFTERIAFWVDLENAYKTYQPSYMESLWNIIAKVDERGLLYKDYKVLPWCPRCGTALSSHELAQGYKDVKDISLYVKFKVKNQEDTYLIAWTTTPWTLPGNVALAVGKDITYAKYHWKGENFIVAKDRGSKWPGHIQEEFLGKDLVGLEYEPLYDFAPRNELSHRVYEADFVTIEDGTGIVHTAIMYGQDDFVLGNQVGLPKHHLVDETGHFKTETDFLSGKSVVDESTAVEILKDLQDKGLLFDKESYTHSYPFCWRCKTRLIYYARDSWYIRMSELRDELVAENKKIHWEPEYIQEGRFGEWLREVKDWAISRERYWGTPLPVWESDSGKRLVIGSLDELQKYSKTGELPKNEEGEVDLHRPYVDDVVLEKDGEEYRRVKEVMDVWFDSGGMPFAQDHYPFENREWVEGPGYPADYIAEAIDQTRGWFYTLHAIGVLVGRGRAYKNVICLGHLLDAEGKKMSKSVGNVVNPWEAADTYGIDTLRLWMMSVNQPGESKNFDERTIQEVKGTFTLLDNILKFYELYKADGDLPDPYQSPHVLDRWLLSKLASLSENITEHLDAYRVLEPARALRTFITDFSQWYVRRSRERLKGEGEDQRYALATLCYALKQTAVLMAPFAPFMSETVYQKMRTADDPESVHLAPWLELSGKNAVLEADMEKVRASVAAGLAARGAAGIKVRQPLAMLVIPDAELAGNNELVGLIKDEVNVKTVTVGAEVSLDTDITPELREEGMVRELIRSIQEFRKSQGSDPTEHISLTVHTDEKGKSFVEKHIDVLKRGALLDTVSFAAPADGAISIEDLMFSYS